MADKVLMYVSKEHQFHVKKLYKIIFQLHKSLPPEMRSIGDSYVRNEFKLHKTATPEHTSKFMSEWSNYALTLGKQLHPKSRTKIGLQLDEKRFDEFNDDQVQQIHELFQEITKVAAEKREKDNKKNDA